MNKKQLDTLVKEFEVTDFIKDDPIQFPHRFNTKQNIEISGFISALFAYGNRKKIIENLNCIHETLGANPYDFVMDFNTERGLLCFGGFCYRFNKEGDIIFLINAIKLILTRFNSLEDAFLAGYSDKDKDIRNALINFVELFGESRLISNPKKGSACKRLNMFLRWMVRKGPVDFGIWSRIPASKLIIPVDVHVSRISRTWGLTERKSDDWRTAEEITENLKQFDGEDPTRYDFAIFGSGVSGAA